MFHVDYSLRNWRNNSCIQNHKIFTGKKDLRISVEMSIYFGYKWV